MGASLGALNYLYMPKTAALNVIPCDFVANNILVIAWHLGKYVLYFNLNSISN